MKTNPSFCILASAGFLALAPLVAQADSVANLQSLVQRNRLVISSNASIDEANPEVVPFRTDLAGQLVELNLKAARLNDSFISAINFPQVRTGSGGGHLAFLPGPVSGKSRDNTPTDITFGNLVITLDGCDVTAALLAQCNALPIGGTCWDVNATATRPTFAGTFGTQVYLNLSALNPQNFPACNPVPAQTSFFDANHTDHQLQFSESMTGQGKGGALTYQVIVYHKAY